MKRIARPIANIAVILVLTIAAHSVRADVVADWNAIAVQSTVTAARPGPTGVIDIAMVHAAVYDAVQAIERRYQPYYVDLPNSAGNPIAAAARAARDVLIIRFPSQTDTIHASYLQYLITHDIPENDPGITVGIAAAARIVASRACDGSFPSVAPPPFVGGTGVGVWRPTPPANLPMQAPWLGTVTPFLMTRPSQFRADPPPSLSSLLYARDYNEVKAVGALNGSSRTPEQTDVAHFYAGNTLVIWNRALRDVSNANVNNVAESSRLFALATMSVADALIASWNDKNHYVFWRPITAIHEGENDRNPRTRGDAAWESLIVTPPYPDYTSGAVNFATGMTRSMEQFFETDTITFSVTTTNTAPTMQDTRTYQSFSEASEDVVNARVYSGIHFRFADEAARQQARGIAEWAYANYMRPISDGGSALVRPSRTSRVFGLRSYPNFEY